MFDQAARQQASGKLPTERAPTFDGCFLVRFAESDTESIFALGDISSVENAFVDLAVHSLDLHTAESAPCVKVAAGNGCGRLRGIVHILAADVLHLPPVLRFYKRSWPA